ncbi:DUF1758 domain-containing protein [Trichonephila clavipes]|uniref:DUF1758 domain-containing protein n=1 Tax=Trichonephila clavipes TaxID=2585209 RepID=A0A8X6WA29_TRICX|nr:DUF1758 domain-containing protein [Trichonephila clavipes]
MRKREESKQVSVPNRHRWTQHSSVKTTLQISNIISSSLKYGRNIGPSSRRKWVKKSENKNNSNVDTEEKLNRLKDSVKGTLTRLEAFTSEKRVSKDTSVTEIEIKLKKIEQLQINLDKLAEDYCEIETFESLEIIQLDIEDINQRIETTEEGNVILQNTKFGYLVTGTLPQSQQQANCCLISEPSLDITAKEFFELESLPDDSKEITKSKEEIYCEEHFVSTYKRDKTGRFIVRLPIKENAKT